MGKTWSWRTYRIEGTAIFSYSMLHYYKFGMKHEPCIMKERTRFKRTEKKSCLCTANDEA
jgi:hypothetical protein